MVLPLQKLCLAAFRDSLKDRPNPYLHLTPPPNHRQNLRQDLLDLVLAFGVIIQESAYTSLSSPEFLDGLTKVNTQRGITNDGEFLDGVADSHSIQRNGKTIGEGITELKLNIYVWRSGDVHVALNLDSVVRVISQCPNLKLLHLSIGEDKLGRKRWQDQNLLAGLPTLFDGLSSDGGLLNQVPELAPCLSVLENVEELSLSTEVFPQGPCLARERPILNFRCLSSMRLANVHVDAEAWKEFLMTVQNSLVELDVYAVGGWTMEDTNAIMPFPLLNLRSFKMKYSGRYTCQLIKNLMECPKLETVKMRLWIGWEREDAMRLLSQMNVSLEVGIMLWADRHRHRYFGSDSNFKLVNLFKEKIKNVRFQIERWDAQHSTALENLIATCSDSVEISFHIPYIMRQPEEHDAAFHRLTAAVNSDLAPFLCDEAFVSKLRRLELEGSIDPAVLDALFENAANLESLTIQKCPQLSDSHLQLWASQGGKPEHLALWKCENISDDGLVPILISSGQRMKGFQISSGQRDRITIVTWRTLVDHCPFLDMEDMQYMEQLKNLWQ